MLNVVVIICAIIVFFLLNAGNFYFLVYFQHEEDKNQAYFPKFVILVALLLAECTVLLLPFDVSISGGGESHRKDMEIVWAVMFMALAFVLVVVVPFALYYYESWDPEKGGIGTQIKEALKLEICTVISALLVLLIMFFLIGTALIPYHKFTANFETGNTYSPILPTSADAPLCAAPFDCKGLSKDLHVDVTFPVYTIGLISFVGWFFFCVFSGVGLAALPLDLLADYRFRPRKLPLDQVVRVKLELNKRAADLKQLGEKIQAEGRHKKKSRKNQKILNNFRKAVYFLERDLEDLVEAAKGGGNPFIYWAYLFLALCTLAFSICWIVHIIIFMFLSEDKRDPFLNNLFVDLDKSFSFLGTVFYGSFAFHLIWATIKGNMKLGVRVVFFTIHPIRLGATMMNAFLFNVALILLCAVPVVQFCATAFALYAHGTASEMIFGLQITHLHFFRYFFENNVFLYVILIMFGLSFLYLLIFPSDKLALKRRQRMKDDEDGWMIA